MAVSQDRQLQVEYERRRMAHHDAVSLRRDSWVEGHKTGLDEGMRVARQAITDLCELLGIEMTAERQAWLEKLGLDDLDALPQHIKQHRSWPQD